MLKPQQRQSAFTIVELLIVIIVIAILATISIVAYTGIQKRATEVTLQSDLSNASKQLTVADVTTGSYPNPSLPADIKASGNNTFQYTSNGTTFCLSATSPSNSASSYYITSNGTITPGLCTGHSSTGSSTIANGSAIQSITSTNCPTSRTRAVDARDNHTYWVQQLADGRCWMLTNLAYAGGGANTYGDVKALTNGSAPPVYNVAHYYIPSGASVTSEPTNPSTSTDGTGQYGYMYNWCGAMGAQTSTTACANAATPLPSTTISICPAGWRLPTGGSGGEFVALNTAINSGSTSNDAGLRSTWLAQRGGIWNAGVSYQGTVGFYWSSTQSANNNANLIDFSNSNATPTSFNSKNFGFSVRCTAT